MKVFAFCVLLVDAGGLGLTFFFRGITRELAHFDEWEADLWGDPEVCPDMDCPCHWEDAQ